MKKLVLLYLLFPIILFGQKNNLTIDVSFVLPGKQLKEVVNPGWGTGSTFEHNFNRYFSGIASFGIAHFTKKTIETPPYSISTKTEIVSVKIGGKFHITYASEGQKSLYAVAELGPVFITGDAWVNDQKMDIDDDTVLGYTLGIGYRIRKWDFSYRNQFITQSDTKLYYSDFRIAHIVTFKKKVKN